jgi:hypothetical protein
MCQHCCKIHTNEDMKNMMSEKNKERNWLNE